MKKEFTLTGVLTLDLRSLGDVAIQQGHESRVIVEIDGDEEDQIAVSQNGNTVAVRGSVNHGASGTTIISSGRNVTILGDLSSGTIIAGGRVIVNGQDVTDQRSATPAKKPVRIKITAPARSNARLGAISRLDCEIALNDVNLDVSGHSGLSLTAVSSLTGRIDGHSHVTGDSIEASLNIRLEGHSSIRFNTATRTALNLQVSGHSSIQVSRGTFTDVKADCSGHSQIGLQGPVTGSVDADVSGHSSFTHQE